MAVATARELGGDPHDELALYIVHGLLHLCGYDDSTEEQSAAMNYRQSEILNAAALLRRGIAEWSSCCAAGIASAGQSGLRQSRRTSRPNRLPLRRTASTRWWCAWGVTLVPAKSTAESFTPPRDRFRPPGPTDGGPVSHRRRRCTSASARVRRARRPLPDCSSHSRSKASRRPRRSESRPPGAAVPPTIPAARRLPPWTVMFWNSTVTAAPWLLTI